MKEKRYKKDKSLFSVICFVCLILCLGIVYGGSLIATQNKVEAVSSSTSIENYDDYIDYYRANSSEPVNRGVIAFYEAIDNNIEEVKSGSFTISMRDEGVYSQLSSLSTDDLYRAWAGAANALLYDNPENFFIEFTNITMSTVTTGFFTRDITLTSSNCYIDGIYNQSQLNSMLTELRTTREEIYQTMYSQLGSDPTDYQIVYFINDYLVENVTYDQTLSRNFVHTVYGSIVNGLAVCDGYSYGAQYLLDGLGITNLVVSGDAYNPSTGSSEGHMWSYVKLYGHWYGLDVTWNDPIYGYTPSQGVIDQNKVKYFLVGWDETTQSGFYQMPGDRERRVVSNYQIYFSYSNGSTLYLELPCPEIETSSYVDPEFEVNQQREMNGSQVTRVTITLDGQNMLDNMSFAYKFSRNGIAFGGFVSCEGQVLFDDASYNGTYKFYIITDEGKVVKESESITIGIGQIYSLSLNAPEGVGYSLSPNKEGYVAGEYVELRITNLPIGMEISSITSEQVDIEQLSENVYAFNFASADVELSISLQQKLYTITVGQLEGLSYQLSANEAYYNDEVTLTITSLPIGKNLVGLSGVEYQGELVVGEPISFTMPAENVEIGVVLEDIVYNIAVTNNSGYEIICKDSAIYQEEVTISAGDLLDNQRLVISGIEEDLITYLTNKEAALTMPADNISLTIAVQELEEHAIGVVEVAGVEVAIGKEQAYFGQEIVIDLTYDFQQYRIVSVRVNGVEAEKLGDFQYSFIMQDEEVTVEIETYQIPGLTITNDLQYQVDFYEGEDGYYYLITLQNLPSTQYVKSVTAVDESGKIVFVVTQLSSTEFRVEVESSDITLTFNISDRAVLPDDGNDIYFLAIFLIFVGVVAFIALIYFLVKKSKRTL